VLSLNALAPTRSEAPFLVTQIIVLALLVAIAVGGVIRFRGEPIRTDRV
jgi:hypothetical protein